MEETSKHGANTSKECEVGNYTLMIDETPEQPNTKGAGNKTGHEKMVRRGASNTLWR